MRVPEMIERSKTVWVAIEREILSPFSKKLDYKGWKFAQRHTGIRNTMAIFVQLVFSSYLRLSD